MKIGLYFGTYNPVHVGHLVIANYMAEFTDLDQVWLVVSPQNPLKEKSSLLADYHRLALVRIAIDDNLKLRASDIEFNFRWPAEGETNLYIWNPKRKSGSVQIEKITIREQKFHPVMK